MEDRPIVAQVVCSLTAATRASLDMKEVRARRVERKSSVAGLIERAERAHHERLHVMEEDLREY
jgi:hypothetical protein